jgi:hypothetical protein
MAMKDVFSSLAIMPLDGSGFKVTLTEPITSEISPDDAVSTDYGFTDWADLVAFVGQLAQQA